MGFFSKIKQNLKHGGVKLKLEAPASVNLKENNLPLTVALTASEPQTVKSISVKLIRREVQTSADQGSPPIEREFSSIVQDGPFNLAAGETKQVAINLPLNVSDAAQDLETAGHPALAAGAEALGKLQRVMEVTSGKEYEYWLNAAADVDGISFDPSDSKSLSVFGVNAVGSSFKIGD